MIDLTPLDVRKKRGDFAKALRGYETQEVDVFLELVAERMEALVKENLQLKERSERLGEQVKGQEGREQAVHEALVTAQELRRQVQEQAVREAELLEREARGRIDRMLQDAERLVDERRGALEDLERHRHRFLKAFRSLLERELDAVEVESRRTPLEEVTLDLDLGRRDATTPEAADEAPGPEEARTAETSGALPADGGPLLAEGAASQGSVPQATGAASHGSGPQASGAVPGEPVAGKVPSRDASGQGAAPQEVMAEDSVGENAEDSLWLSSILKRDREENG